MLNAIVTGMGWAGLIITLLIWGGVLALAIWGLFGRGQRHASAPGALTIVQRRYALGEISLGEYLQAIETLRATPTTHGRQLKQRNQMSRIVRPPRRAIPLALLAASVVIVVLAIAITSTTRSQQASAPPPQQAAVPHFVDINAPGAPRTLVIAGADETLPGTSNTAGVLMSNLRSGQLPADTSSAVVMSDSNCQPDADGISHCLNELNVGGVVVTVQHHHAMAAVPCLSPGEKVQIVSLARYREGL